MRKSWYAIRTKPRQEEIAKLNFEKQNFITYLPKVKTTIRHARKITNAARPLFPGYLFLQLSTPETYLTSLSSTYGAIGPVRFGDYIPPVPDWIIEEIKKREDEKGLVSLFDPKRLNLKKGDKVKVKLNHYDELEGIFYAQRGQDRAIILLNILKNQVKTEVPLECLKKV